MATATLQAVTFDLWETLMHDSPASADGRHQARAGGMHAALAGGGKHISTAAVELACRDIWTWLQESYWDRHVDPGFEAQISWLRHRFQMDAGETDLIERLRLAYVEPIFGYSPLLDVAALSCLRELTARGLKLALICNTSLTPGTALRALLERWHIGQLLPVQLYSDELGIRKPAVEIFRLAAARLEVSPASMLHVGDRLDADVEGAQAAGAQALQVSATQPLASVCAVIDSRREAHGS